MTTAARLLFVLAVCFASCVYSHKTCTSVSPAVPDSWCDTNCNFATPYCPAAMCKCDGTDDNVSTDDTTPTTDDWAPADDDTGPDYSKVPVMLATYWASWGYSTNVQPYTNRLLDVWVEYNHIMVAFAQFSSSGDVSIFHLDNETEFRSDMKILQKQGKKIILSVGGEGCNWSGVTETSALTVATDIAALVTSFGFDGVDLDDEALSGKASQDALIAMTKALRSILSPGALIVLTAQDVYITATESLDRYNYYGYVLDSVGDQIDYVFIMAYNNNQDVKVDYQTWADGYQNSVSTWAGFPSAKLVLGLLSDPIAGGNGFLEAQTAASVITELKAQYAGKHDHFGGVMTWNANSDNNGTYSLALYTALFN